MIEVRGTTDKQETPPSCLLSPPALILPLSRTLPPSTGVKVVEGGSVRERGRIKAWGEKKETVERDMIVAGTRDGLQKPLIFPLSPLISTHDCVLSTETSM